ncbi:twin-arginine translocase subunit TatC [Rothia terrae]|uniref:Sec-independent protein translocase protein TatC n=1 Tax=Rothia terrae TaxID=396015 RepID=A0A7H2BB54_9MICC|nr:twin-arginine translocase subunit TatC [Rothia terrae]MDT0188783.1 twin-arginine translocase subunit TatC [Rothia terrae]NKZ33484.1 twin-arginine translocase subunit TatC [Rothia terrae]QNV36900.1 twin-arginine translocase subunit TatC [Rothia terrae]
MANPNSRKNNPQAKMALGEHFREFRNRLIKSAVATVLTSIAGFFLYEPFIDAISGPLAEINSIDGREAVLNYATPAASFNLMVTVSLYIGLVLASPVWLYQLWAFITPALYKKEKLYAIGFVAAAVPMFFIGLAVAWWCIPAAIKALTMFNPQGTTNIMGADIYIAFFIKFMVVFGVAFVLPVVLVGVNMMGLIRGRTILKAWRWVIVLVATLAAAVAPGTDPMTMFYLAAPLIIFFFIAIGICMMNDKRRDKKNAKLAAGLTDDELNRATSAEELDQLGRVEQN